MVGLDAARALPLNLHLRRNALAVPRYKHVVAHLEFRRSHVRLVVVLLYSSFAITRSFLRHQCVDLRHSTRQLLNLHKLLRFDKIERRVDRHVVLQHQRERRSLRVFSEDLHQRLLVQPRR
jgi:hypothetical protein